MLPHLLLHGVQYLSSGYSTNPWGQQEPECSQSDDAHSDVSPWPAALQALMQESIGSWSLYLSAANSTDGRQVDLLAVGRSRSAANSPGSHQVDLLAVECSRSATLGEGAGPALSGRHQGKQLWRHPAQSRPPCAHASPGIGRCEQQTCCSSSASWCCDAASRGFTQAAAASSGLHSCTTAWLTSQYVHCSTSATSSSSR